jgi:rubredoxin
VPGTTLRGTRLGGVSSGQSDRGEAAPTRCAAFYCANGHATHPTFAADASLPEQWDCPRCGLPAGLDPAAPPSAPRLEPFKSHLAYVRERRTPEEEAQILAEALERRRIARGG